MFSQADECTDKWTSKTVEMKRIELTKQECYQTLLEQEA